MRQLDHGLDVLVERVDPARTDESQQVQTAPVPAGMVDGLAQDRVVEEAAIGNRLADARQVLQDREARAQVQVADLRVAHLARRQAHRLAGRLEPAGRPLGRQPVPGRHPRGHQSVASRIRPDPEAVEHAEDDRARPPFAHPRSSAAARTMPAKRSASSDAPPTSAPSRSGMAKNSGAFSGVQLPP